MLGRTLAHFRHSYSIPAARSVPLLGVNGASLQTDQNELYRFQCVPEAEAGTSEASVWLVQFDEGQPPQCIRQTTEPLTRTSHDRVRIFVLNGETIEIGFDEPNRGGVVDVVGEQLVRPIPPQTKSTTKAAHDFGVFEIVSAVISLAMSYETDQEYRARFSGILSDTDSLVGSMTNLAALVRGIPNQVMLAQARGYMQSAQIKMVDADSAQSNDGKMAAYNDADKFAVLALGALEGNDVDEAVTTGLLGIAISLRFHILHQKRRLGDPDARPAYLAFAQSQSTELATRCSKIENAWNARRSYYLRPDGIYNYIVDGQFRGSSSFEDPITPMYQFLMGDRREEIYPTLHPMYKAAACLLWKTGRLELMRFDNGTRAFLIDSNRAYPILLPRDLSKWFGIESSAAITMANDIAVAQFNNLLIGAPITEDRSPYNAQITNWSHAAAALFPELVFPIGRPQTSGELWRARGMNHVWWAHGEGSGIVLPTLHWVATPGLIEQYFPGFTIQEVSEYQLDGTYIGRNIDV
jgi:hypothetical protein